MTYERMYDNTSKRRASCSVVRSCHVGVSHGVHVVGHSGLNEGESVLEVVHNVPYPVVS